MKKSNKKGFTIVELVIVIAVIAILAAVLIPTFASIVKKANESKDTQLIKNLNTALQADTEGATTMAEALEDAAAFGYDIAKINASATGNEILWDSVNNVFCYFKSGKIEYIPEAPGAEKAKDEDFWVIASKPSEKYSTYLYNYEGTGVEEISTGIDTGSAKITKLTYANTGTAKSVVIATNGGELVVNAPEDSIKHYGESSFINIEAIKDASFHEFGRADLISITKGKVELEAGAVVEAVHAEGAAKLVVSKDAKVESVSAKDGVTLTTEGFKSEAIEVKDLSTVKSETIKAEITTAAEFLAFAKAGDNTKAKLLADIELKNVAKFNVRSFEVDLNGHTLTLNSQGSRPFELQAGIVVTVNGEREGSKVIIPAECGSYGMFALRGEGAKLYLNGGEYVAAMDAGAVVKTFAKNTHVELTNLVASVDGGKMYTINENDTNSVEGSKLVVDGGSYSHGYAVDNRVDSEKYGLPCALFTAVNSEFKNVKVVSKFFQGLEALKGTHTLTNCDFKLLSVANHSKGDHMNAAIGVGRNANATVNGGSFSGKYGLYIFSTGATFTNNGAEFSGSSVDYVVSTQEEGYTVTITGMDNFTKK